MQQTITSKILKTEAVNWRDIEIIQNAKFKELSPVSYNKLKKSLLQNNFVMPFFVWESEGTLYLLDGKHRIDMLHDLARDGFNVPNLLPATFIDCADRKEASKFVLLFSSSYAQITKEGLASFLETEELDIELVSEEIDIPYLEFGDLLLGDILPEGDARNADLDRVPEVPEEALVMPNDYFIIDNRHILYCADSLKTENVLGVLKEQKPELTFTDPPYELVTKGGGVLKHARSMKQISDNKVDHFKPSDLRLYSTTNIFFHNKPLIKAYIELAEREGQNYDLAFYKKTNTPPNYNSHMMTDVEYIAIIGRLNPNKGLDKEKYSKLYVGKKDSDNPLSYSKPVELCEKYVGLYSKSLVLDMFLGSGSTLIACERLGRSCVGLEMDPKMAQVCLMRYIKLFPQCTIECVTRGDFDVKEALNG